MARRAAQVGAKGGAGNRVCMLSFFFGLLYGCGADVVASCEAYAEAVNTCYADYSGVSGVDLSASMIADDYCVTQYEGQLSAESAAWFDCLAGVYAGTDCSDTRAYSEIDWSACDAG
jgi:hypothetical protein